VFTFRVVAGWAAGGLVTRCGAVSDTAAGVRDEPEDSGEGLPVSDPTRAISCPSRNHFTFEQMQIRWRPGAKRVDPLSPRCQRAPERELGRELGRADLAVQEAL